MSDYDANRSEEALQQHDNISDILDDETGATNTSIVGIVKSRVSSIIPNTLTNWFYPSTPRNDSINGGIGKRHRREDEDVDEDVDDDAAQEEDENEEQRRAELGRNLFSQEPDDHSDDSNNSEDALTTSPNSRRNLNSRPPPSKRTKLYMDVPNMGDNSLMTHQPLVASTPTTSINLRSTSNAPASQAGRSYNRVSYLDPYENQSTKEPAYNFQESNIKNYGAIFEANNNAVQSGTFNSLGISSRRSLNIPAVSHLPSSMSTVRQDLPSTSTGLTSGISAVGPRRTSTTIEEEEIVDRKQQQYGQSKLSADAPIVIEDDEHIESASAQSKYNGRSASVFTYNKRPKFINGEEDDIGDSASECGGSARAGISSGSSTGQRRTGLFNMSTTNSRNISRTSSFGNGLNFSSHLEGRKSLYSAPQSTQLNKSTLSLNSLNRRQFNASLYGSTSNLSDSRLLNVFSPFYNGRTTYGGAAAYNKFGTSGSGVGIGAGTNAMRITPTLIRPTSSLSTRSSSNASLAAAAANIGGDNSSTLSNTAKRMLDLLNDFPTPIGEAKKMANHKVSEHSLLQASSRLSDRDLQASRSMRLAHVRTPYTRPAVTLLPTNTNGRNSQLPPMQELQVPSMSQLLLQMKKTQTTTERSRQIATEHSARTMKSGVTDEYTLPINQNAARESDGRNPHTQQQQKHTNKIKHKSAGSMRHSKEIGNLADEAPPPPLVLPTIAFPSMKSVPKIDIPIPAQTSSASKISETKSRNEFKTDETAAPRFSSSGNKCIPDTTDKSALKPNAKTHQMQATNGKITYKFSTPKEFKSCMDVSDTSIKKEFKFSAPLAVSRPGQVHAKPTTEEQPQPALPQLKSGSVIDALRKPSNFETSTPSAPTAASLSSGSGFGAQFKKSSDEWDCDTCLVRNKQEAAKCVSCQTPRKATAQAAPKSTPVAVNSTPFSSSFGSQFKMASSEWECDACMLRNKQEAAKCVACTTPRSGSAAVKAPSEMSILPPPTKHTFGDAFKPKANTWKCTVCLISNENESDACAACGTKKPGSVALPAAPSPSFRFGIAAPQKSTSATDEGFKNLAAEQKASKWECEACMTRNDAARLKCACCEQAKPGTQSSNDNAPKFAFGTTASAKFTFGFGAAANAPKEEELRKGESKLAAEQKPVELEKTEATPVHKPGSFSFGLKSTNAPATPVNTTGDGAGTSTKFKFGSDAAVTSTTGSTFGSPSVSSDKTSETLAPSTMKMNAAPSVKLSLPTTIASFVTSSTSTTKSATTAPLFSIGSSATSFAQPASIERPDVNKTAVSGGFGIKPASTTSTEPSTSSKTSFSFGAPSTSSAATGPTPSAAIKPTFMFGSTSTAATTGTGTPLNSTATSTTSSKPVFGTTQSISTNPKPNIFASFGSAPDAANAAKASPMAPTSTTFGSTPAAINVFGTFGSQSDVPKPTAAATPLFGSAASSTSLAPSNQATNPAAATPFVFGSPAASSSNATTNATTSTFGASASTAWPKENFVFGSTSANTSNEASKSVFPGFGKTQPTGSLGGIANSAPSIFSNMNSTKSAESATFGNAPANTGSPSIFAVPSGGNASTGTPAFGSTPFGSGTTAPPAFQQFNSFGAAASSATSAVDGAPAPKKSEPAFNFGAPTASSGFNFGSTANKPAFNFTPATQPAFNFTGGSTNMQPQTTEPFQFGATPAAPVFNFSGGVVETTPNAPFQFSAAATPDTNNIFSPTPTPGQPQTQLSARRKIRTPNRRLPPR